MRCPSLCVHLACLTVGLAGSLMARARTSHCLECYGQLVLQAGFNCVGLLFAGPRPREKC
jgi:hypothetical protein